MADPMRIRAQVAGDKATVAYFGGVFNGAALILGTGFYLQLRLGSEERELFAVLFLDTRHTLIEFEVLSIGTVDCSTARSSTGHTGWPLVRSSTYTHPCLVGCASALMRPASAAGSAHKGAARQAEPAHCRRRRGSMPPRAHRSCGPR